MCNWGEFIYETFTYYNCKILKFYTYLRDKWLVNYWVVPCISGKQHLLVQKVSFFCSLWCGSWRYYSPTRHRTEIKNTIVIYGRTRQVYKIKSYITIWCPISWLRDSGDSDASKSRYRLSDSFNFFHEDLYNNLFMQQKHYWLLTHL